MSRREDVLTTFWDERDELSMPAILIDLWSTTNPRCGMAGMYRVPRRMIVEGRLSDEDLEAALVELREAGRVFFHDGILWNRERVQNLATQSPAIAKSIGTDLLHVAQSGSPLLRAFADRYSAPDFWLLPKLIEANSSGSSAGRWDTIIAVLQDSQERVWGPPGEGLDHQRNGGFGEGLATLHGQGQGHGQGESGRAADDVEEPVDVGEVAA